MNKIEKLKSELFRRGRNAIEDFLGFEIDTDGDMTDDEIDSLMDDVYMQMPDDRLDTFYKKYDIAEEEN